MDVSKLKLAFEKAKNESTAQTKSTLSNLQNSISNYGTSWKSQRDTDDLIKSINFEKIRASFNADDELLKKLNDVEKKVLKQRQLYSQYETAEDYDKAKREYGYSTKYQGKTYDDISKYLSSDDYKTMRRRGLVSDEENTWLKNFETNIATADQIQSKIDALGGSAEKIKNKIHNLNLDLDDLQLQYREGKITEQDYKSKSTAIQKEIAAAEKNMEKIPILETAKAQKKQVEDFNKKWANVFANFDGKSVTPNNNKISKILAGSDYTGDEVWGRDKFGGELKPGNVADYETYSPYLEKDEKRKIQFLADKVSSEKAQEYFNDLITVRLDAAYNNKIKADAAGFTSSDGWAALGGSLGSVVTSLGSGVETVGNWLTGNTDRRSTLSSVTTGLREGTKTHWDGTWGEEAWDFLYDTGMSAADSLAAAGLSAVVPFSGEILLGASAAANTYNDMLDRGITGGDAILGSVAAGVAEGLFEHLSIGKILDSGDITKGWTKAGLKQAAKKVGTDMLVNASEETLTEISNIVADNLINGDLSSYAIAAEQYYMQGYSAEEAKKMAAQDLGKQVAMAGLSGALMGFVFGAGGSVAGLSNSKIKNSKAGNAVLNTENGLETLKTIAKQKGDSEVKSAAEKLTEKSKPSEVGYVFNRLYEQSLENSINQMTPVLTQNGATKGGVNSAKGFATQIVKTALAPQSDDKRAKERTLRVNNITKDVYTGFADEGKYGADTLLQLNELTSFKTKTNEQIAEGINKDIAINKAMAEYYKPAVAEAYESNRPTFGTNELPAEVRGNLEKMVAGKPLEVAQQLNEGNIQQRPAPQKAAQKKITPLGEKIVKAFGKANGVNVVFTDELVDGVGNGKFDTDKTIYISRYTNNPIKVVIKHEFTHSTEKSKLYPKFQKYVFEDSKAFQTWLNNKGYASWKEAVKNEVSKYEAYKDEIKDETAKKALENANLYKIGKAEVIANFVSETLFNEDGTDINGEITENFLQELKQADRTLWQRFVDFIKSIFARMKEHDANNKDIIKLEQKFLRLVETSRQERAKGEGEKSQTGEADGQYSLVEPFTDNEGNEIKNAVLLDTDFFDGLSPRNWGEKLRYFVENRAKNNPLIMSIVDEKGNVQKLQFAKNNDIIKTKSNKTRKVIDKLSSSSDNISKLSVIHIDEIVEVSEKNNPYFSNENNHQWLDKNGWLHRTANVINSKNGNIYEIIIDIAKTADGRVILYATDGKIKKVGQVNVNSLNKRGSRPHSNFDTSIPNSTENVKGQYSLPDLDTEYIKAVENNDIETAQRLVDEVARNNGYTIHSYHGTRDKTFTKFKKEFIGSRFSFDDKGFFFIDRKSIADDYAHSDFDAKAYGRILNVYLKVKNPLIVNKGFCLKEGLGNPFRDDDAIGVWDAYSEYFKEEAENRKADGIILDDGMSKMTVVFDPNQIKSAEPITYDDKGNVIPLSKRFNSEYEDIRYSLPDIPDIAKTKSTDELSAMVERGEITPTQALNALADQFGAIPKGENPKVDVVVPSRVAKQQGVRRFGRTALESGHLTDNMSESAKKEMIDGALNYQITTNKTIADAARKKVKNNINEAIQEWEGLIASKKIPTAEEIALGEALLIEAANAGNENDVAMYLAEIAAIGTQMGQGIQALTLLKKMSGVGQLHYISRVIAQLNGDLKRRYGEKYSDVLKLDPSLETILAKSKSKKEIDAVIDDIITDVAKQMPSTWADKFNAWRYLAMLGNTRTHIRNFLGNAVFRPAIYIKNILGAVGERIFIKDESNRTKSFKVKKEYKDFAQNDFNEIKDILTSGGKMSPSDLVQDRRKIYTSKAFAWLEGARRFNFDMLEKEDLYFLKRRYISSLAGALQAKKIDVNNITEKQLQEVRNYAIKEAQKATYRDFSSVANAINKLAHPDKNANVLAKGFGLLAEGALPFKKTPINVLKRGIEYSPVGLAKTLAESAIAYKRGEFSGADFIDSISANLTGTGILLLGMLLQSIGWITGGLDYDDEDALERMSGAQPYAINFGEIIGDLTGADVEDITYTIDWMAPSSLPLLVGSEISKANKEDENLSFYDALATIGEPLTELSFLSGVNDLIQGLAYSGKNSLGPIGEAATNLAASYVSQYFPTVGGQVARTFDDTRRSNFVDKNSSVPKSIQKAYQKALGKIPFAENTKVPYIDAWGKTEVNDSALLRTFENFVSPGYVSTIKDDKVNNELAKIYTETGESGVIPKRASNSIQVDGVTKNLTADEYVQYATDKGQYSRKYLEDFINHPMYSGLDNQSKADIISDLYSYANAKAESNVSDYDYTTESTYKTAAKLEASGIDPVSYYIAKVATSTENADTDGSGTVTKKEKQKALRNAGFSSKDINTIININKK